MSNRREFLKHAAGATAGMFLLGSRATSAVLPSPQDAAAKRRAVMIGGRRVKTVDMHTHTTVPEVADLLKGTPSSAEAAGAGIL